MPLDPTLVTTAPPPEEVLADLARLRSELDKDLPAKEDDRGDAGSCLRPQRHSGL